MVFLTSFGLRGESLTWLAVTKDRLEFLLLLNAGRLARRCLGASVDEPIVKRLDRGEFTFPSKQGELTFPSNDCFRVIDFLP